MTFNAPTFEAWTILYTAIGVSVFWSKWGREKLKVYMLSSLVEYIPVQDKYKILIEFMIFLFLGCLIAIGIVQPTNAAQAVTAGFGWTGFFTKRETS